MRMPRAAAAAAGRRTRKLGEASPVTLPDDQQPTSHSQPTAGASGKVVQVAGGSGRALAASTKEHRSGLPNAVCPSDHVPLGVVLRLPSSGEPRLAAAEQGSTQHAVPQSVHSSATSSNGPQDALSA